jgi:hypothetical protein
LFINLRSLDERVKDVENAVATPCVWRLAEDLNVFFIASLARDAVSVGAERVELVDEFIDNIPRPVVLECLLDSAHIIEFWLAHRGWFKINGSIGVEDEVEQAAIVVIACKFDLQRCGKVQRLCSSSKS